MPLRPAAAAAMAMIGFAAISAAQAAERCTRLGFSVNDFGKEGPTNDAKRLLDGHIAQWAAQNGIKSYRTGTKTVSCELYLDLIVFDEHTCKAEASVCWSGGPASALPPGKATQTKADQTNAAPGKAEPVKAAPVKADGPKAPPAERAPTPAKAKAASNG